MQKGLKSLDTKKTQEVNVTRHTAKNSVFLDLFQNKSYLLKLYKTLHPEDTTATEDALTDVTIGNILTDNLYNDLGFIAGKNYYKSRKVKMPNPELYVIFTGIKGRKPNKILWNDTKGGYGNHSHMQRQKCLEGVFA